MNRANWLVFEEVETPFVENKRVTRIRCRKEWFQWICLLQKRNWMEWTEEYHPDDFIDLLIAYGNQWDVEVDGQWRRATTLTLDKPWDEGWLGRLERLLWNEIATDDPVTRYFDEKEEEDEEF